MANTPTRLPLTTKLGQIILHLRGPDFTGYFNCAHAPEKALKIISSLLNVTQWFKSLPMPFP